VRALGGRGLELAIAAAVCALDQWTKSLVDRALPLYHEQPLVPDLLSLRHARNPGMAFGLLARTGLPHQALWLDLVGLVALALLVAYLLKLPKRPRLPRIALAMILGGALGNLADRIRLGYVTDFIHVFHGSWQFHDFNVADSAITVGVILLLLAPFWHFREPA
jgi:signal peptidase II